MTTRQQTRLVRYLRQQGATEATETGTLKGDRVDKHGRAHPVVREGVLLRVFRGAGFEYRFELREEDAVGSETAVCIGGTVYELAPAQTRAKAA